MVLLDWLHDTLGINGRTEDEVITSCPKCGFPRFYFNLNKGLGYCHRASCHWSPTLKELCLELGSEPGDFIPSQQKIVAAPIAIELPKSTPIIEAKDGGWVTNDLAALTYLDNRQVSRQMVYTFGIRANSQWIVVPVYDITSRLVSYVARNRNPHSDFRYNYPKGGRHKSTLLGWVVSSQWSELILVENTFVSLWLRGAGLPCTTNFGSHLSKEQIDLIKRSKVSKVTLLWDEGAEQSANKAVQRLRNEGVAASFRWIKGQPDNYSVDQLKEIVYSWTPVTPVSTN